MWSDEGLLEIDRTLPEGAETSSVCEISSHVCESFFISPENTLDCEQPIRRVYQSLSTAVEGLLEMALDSSKQLEEARQLHRCVEREFRHRNEEMAQAMQKQQELLERLREESAAKDRLALELHTAKGLLEGFKVEKVDLQEALGKKEESEQQLILELEDLRKQLQQAARELLTLKEEKSVLWNQKETLTNEAKEREAALQEEVESLTRVQWESRKQSEKDRATLLSQMRVLESELEDQLVQHRGCAQLAEEVATLKQQLAALDKHLRSQRQFMDDQAAEREHEREEFQQEIQRLEGQLRQAARPRPPGPRDSQVELLQEKLREKLDGFNELVIKKDFADQQLLIQEEEIKRLEETKAILLALAHFRHALEQQTCATPDEPPELRQLRVQCARLSHQLQVLYRPFLKCRMQLDQHQPHVASIGCANPCADDELEQEGVSNRLALAPHSLAAQAKEELEKQKKSMEELKEKEILKQENMGDLLLTTVSRSGLDEAGCPMLPQGSSSRGPEAQPDVTERALLQHENEVVHRRNSEIDELKSLIENLQENQRQLQKDKAEEIEQLHEVIEKLQSELSLMGPKVHEVSDPQAGSLHSELACLRGEGLGGQALRSELQAAQAAKEVFGQLLADQAHGHSQALEALQQRLQDAEEVAARHLAELEHCVALREAEVEAMASQIQEFAATLKAKEAIIEQRKTKGDCPNSKKKTAKRKGSAVHASVQEEGSVATPNSELPQGGAVFESPSCSNTLEGTRGASAAQEQEDCELDVTDLQGQQQTQPPPPQTAHSLELEALRLSLNNMHTAQLELTQANLQKEKETALTELREMLNGRRAQELALLQSRQQCELELLREQHAREKEEMALRSGQEAAELKEKLRSEMEKNAQTIETLKQDWESERELCLENLRQELSLKQRRRKVEAGRAKLANFRQRKTKGDCPNSKKKTAAGSPGKERSTSTPSSRLERSLTASQDPEHSLTEYIHHLEMIQQRLGGLPPDSTQKSCHQKIKQ